MIAGLVGAPALARCVLEALAAGAVGAACCALVALAALATRRPTR